MVNESAGSKPDPTGSLERSVRVCVCVRVRVRARACLCVCGWGFPVLCCSWRPLLKDCHLVNIELSNLFGFNLGVSRIKNAAQGAAAPGL